MLVSIGVFVGSIFVSDELRYTLWLRAMIVALFGAYAFALFNSRRRAELRGVIAHHHLDSFVGCTAILGMLVAIVVVAGNGVVEAVTAAFVCKPELT